MKASYSIPLCLMLLGCGGGSGDATPDVAGSSQQSTLLNDNPVPENAEFKQYRISTFEINPDNFVFAGEKLFLKVYMPSGSVLFLGQISKQSSFFLPLSLPNSEAKVKFDLFSDYEGDESVTGEVVL